MWGRKLQMFFETPNMHHSELGQLVQFFEEYLRQTQDPCPVSIESISRYGGRRGYSTYGGVRISAVINNNRVSIEIDDPNRDSNRIKAFYYSSLLKTEATLSLAASTEDLNIPETKRLIECLLQLAQGKMCLTTVESIGCIGIYGILPNQSVPPVPI
jgi:hypothetical protein